jgi:hypothetical protein
MHSAVSLKYACHAEGLLADYLIYEMLVIARFYFVLISMQCCWRGGACVHQ